MGGTGGGDGGQAGAGAGAGGHGGDVATGTGGRGDAGAAAGGTAGAAAGGTTGTAGGSGTGGTGGAPVEQPSKQTVTFHLTTSGGGSHWVAFTGMGCTVFSIGRLNPTAIVQTEQANPCGPCASCPNPPSGTTVVRAVTTTTAVDLTWDAREITIVREATSCPHGGVASYDHAFAKPVPPGHYSARFAVFGALPAACGTNGICSPPVTTSQTALPYASICTSDAPVDVEFDLPPTGNITVPVPVP
jgi:hypothetical protein